VIACNLAELLGMACGLGFYFISHSSSASASRLRCHLILLLQRKGVRYLEAVIIGLVAVIGACFCGPSCGG